LETLKGCALIRVSTNKQDSFGGSLEQQKNRLQRWVDAQGLYRDVKFEISHWFEERTSGKASNTSSRETLRNVRKLIEAGLVDFVLFEKLDRLSRDAIFNMEFMKLADKYKCEVYDVDSGGKIDMRERGSRLGFFVKNMNAEDYSLELSEKMSKKVREAMVNNGKGSSTKPVLGIDGHPTKPGIYVINKGEQKIVIDIYKKFIATGSYKETLNYCIGKRYLTKIQTIKKKIDSEGVLIPARKTGGKDFSLQALKKLLSSRKIRGVSEFEDDWGQFPQMQDSRGFVQWKYEHGEVVLKELTDQVDEALEAYKTKKRRHKKRVYLLSGILKKVDGDTFTGEAAKSGKHIYYYNKKHDVRISRDELEQVVIQRLKTYLSDSSTVNAIFKRALKDKDLGPPLINERIYENRIAINDTEIELDGFSKAIRKVILSPENVVNVCKLLEEERSKTECRLKALRAEQSDLKAQKDYIEFHFNNQKVSDFLGASMDKLDKMSRSELKTKIQKIFHSIIVDPENYTCITFRVRPDPSGTLNKKRKSKTTSAPNGAEVRLTSKWWSL